MDENIEYTAELVVDSDVMTAVTGNKDRIFRHLSDLMPGLAGQPGDNDHYIKITGKEKEE